jgi:hypothetical protein
MSEVYDPDTCVTAGELRALGAIGLPPEIPDCAWVPRADLMLSPGRGTLDEDGVTLHVPIEVTFRTPLRWVDVKVRLDP